MKHRFTGMMLVLALALPGLAVGMNVPGCTDPFACNYDPAATEDDGSCYYTSDNDVCAGAQVILPGSLTVVDNTCSSLNGAGSCWQDGVQNDVWFAFTMPASGSTVIECTPDFGGSLSDSQLSVYSACGSGLLACDDDGGVGSHARIVLDCSSVGAGSMVYIQVDGFSGSTGQCGLSFTVETISGCTDPGAANFEPCATIDDGSCTEEGCTDLEACNFNAQASINDGSCCYAHCVSFSVTAGSYPAEIGYTLTDGDGVTYLQGEPGSAAPAEATLCLPDGCYTLTMTDFFGDGWNGAIFTLLSQDGLIASGDFPNEPFYNAFERTVTFTLGGGVVGCTDASACNFDPSATCDDGSCDFVSCYGCMDLDACNFNPDAVFDDGSCCYGTCLTLELYDAYGDTWDDGYYIITDAAGNELAFGTMSTNDFIETHSFCLPDGCYAIYVYGGSFPDEVSWVIYGANEGILSGDGYSDAFTHFSTGAGDCSGCLDPAACNYDPLAVFSDDSCIEGPCVDGDNPWTALPVTLSNTCNAVVHSLEGTTTTAVSWSEATTGEDIWFSFVATTSGVSIECTSLNFDAVLELQEPGYVLVDEENQTNSGTERMNRGDLIPGQTYYLAVRNFDSSQGTGSFSICFRSLRDSRCDYGSGPYALCSVFKADNVQANQYTFRFTSQEDGALYTYTTPSPITRIQLSWVDGLQCGESYVTEIDAVHHLTDGAGNAEVITVLNDEPCVITMANVPLSKMRSNFNCANTGSLPIYTIVQAEPKICGVASYTWEFVNTNGNELPITYTLGINDRRLRLSWVPGLQMGQSYMVRVRVTMINGQETEFGTAECVSITGLASMDQETPEMSFSHAGSTEGNWTSEVMLFPNPSDGQAFRLLFSELPEGMVTVVCRDMMGREVFREVRAVSNDTGFQPHERLSSGIYLVEVTGGDGLKATIRWVVR